MRVKIRRQEDGAYTIDIQRTRRGERKVEMSTGVARKDVGKVIAAKVGAVRGQLPGEPVESA